MNLKKLATLFLRSLSFCSSFMTYGSENFHESRDRIYIVHDQFKAARELAQQSEAKYFTLTNPNWDDSLKFIRDQLEFIIVEWDLYLRMRTNSRVVKNPEARKEVQLFFDKFEVRSNKMIFVTDRAITRGKILLNSDQIKNSLNCDQIKELEKNKALIQGLKNLCEKIK